MTLLPLRLEPGADLRRALEPAAAARGSAFVLSVVGSLAGCRLRLAGEQGAGTPPAKQEGA